MKKLLIATACGAAIAMAASAQAATVTNLDDTTHTLVVSDGGNQVEVSVRPGETIEICPTGCFVTMPNGDREALTGNEKIEIETSRGRVF